VFNKVIINNVERATCAGNAGALEAVVAAMRAHADSARL
jgi:hypothetical protein